ncbi:MAG: Uma2 family endonuclease, partial [Gemmataceae bacterium]
FSVAEYEQLGKLGILGEHERVELIRGEIVQKMTIGELHAACVNRLTRLFTRALDDRAIVSIQNPVRLADSEPEPDVALLKPREDFYATGLPTGADVLLVVEVADTSLEYDRQEKGPLYAEAGIPEFWLVNLVEGRLEVHRQPQAGVYQESFTFERGQEVELIALPGVRLAVSAMI